MTTLFPKIAEMGKKKSFGLPLINQIIPNFGPFINCIKGKIATGIQKIKNIIKVGQMGNTRTKYGTGLEFQTVLKILCFFVFVT